MSYSNAFRRPIFLIAIVCAVAVAFFVMLAHSGWIPAWGHLGTPAVEPVYFDMRTVQAAPGAIAQGLNPHLSNPGDPSKRVMNYPILWAHIAGLLRLSKERNYVLFITLYIAAYLVCCIQLLRRYPSIWMLLAVLSGSSLIAMERGNNDLVVFVMVFVAVFLDSAWVAAGVLLLAVLLKLFPVFGALFLWRNRKAFFSFLVAAAAYFMLNHAEIAEINRSTPRSSAFSYGIPSISLHLQNIFHYVIPLPLLLLAFLSMCIALLCLARFRTYLLPALVTDRYIERLFLAGAGIYVATFTVNSNFDYRLIFLMLCVPFLLSLANRATGTVILICLVLSANAFLAVFFLVHGVGTTLLVLANTVLYIVLADLLVLQMFFTPPSSTSFPLRSALNPLHST